MAAGDASLFHGRGSERRESDDVSRGIDMGNGGLERFVHFKFAARNRGESRGFKVQEIGVGLAAYGVHQASGVNVLPAFEVGDDAAALVGLYGRDFFSETEDGALAAHVVAQSFHDFGIHKIEEVGSLFDQRNFHAHGH